MMEALERIKAVILSVDPKASKYIGKGTGSYTVWTPTAPSSIYANGKAGEVAWEVVIERFSKSEDDPIVGEIMAALDGCDFVAYDYYAEYDKDTGYIHHTYECEVV